jgi:cation transport regulator
MTYQQIEELPQEVKDQLPEYGQRIFLAAYNSIAESGGSEEAATRVAWQTIEHSEVFFKDEDGKWSVRTDFPTGGHGGVATMPGS